MFDLKSRLKFKKKILRSTLFPTDESLQKKENTIYLEIAGAIGVKPNWEIKFASNEVLPYKQGNSQKKNRQFSASKKKSFLLNCDVNP